MKLTDFQNRGTSKTHSTKAHGRAPKQEKLLAARYGGWTTPGSGSKSQKGDIKKAVGFIRIEAKTTSKKSFSLTRKLFEKIETAAMSCNEIPVFVIEFLDDNGKPVHTLAVLREEDLHELVADPSCG